MAKSKEVTFEPFERKALPNKIIDSLLNLIKEKQLQPGDKLPAERELAAMMRVGRPSLRAALRVLAAMNVIEIQPGSGAYVSSLETERLVEHLEFVFSLDGSNVSKLFEARKVLELGIIDLAAQHISDEAVAELEACVAMAEAAPMDEEVFHLSDVKFHKVISNAAQNPILTRCLNAIAHLGLASRRQTASIPGALSRAIDEHRAIATALKARDPEAAHQAMAQHLNNSEEDLKQIISIKHRA